MGHNSSKPQQVLHLSAKNKVSEATVGAGSLKPFQFQFEKKKDHAMFFHSVQLQ